MLEEKFYVIFIKKKYHMSRIGKTPIMLPKQVTATCDDNNVVHVKNGDKILTQCIATSINVSIQNNTICLTRTDEKKMTKALHGLYRALINNMVVGVTQGYKKSLELVGVGYKANVQQNILELHLGYSHNIFFVVPKEVTVTAQTAKGKNPIITLESIDKQLIGQVAAKIKLLKKVEPYKGKGIKFVGENIRRKEGKAKSK